VRSSGVGFGLRKTSPAVAKVDEKRTKLQQADFSSFREWRSGQTQCARRNDNKAAQQQRYDEPADFAYLSRCSGRGRLAFARPLFSTLWQWTRPGRKRRWVERCRLDRPISRLQMQRSCEDIHRHKVPAHDTDNQLRSERDFVRVRH